MHKVNEQQLGAKRPEATRRTAATAACRWPARESATDATRRLGRSAAGWLVVVAVLLAQAANASVWVNDGGTYTLDASNPSAGGALWSPDPLSVTTVNLVDGGYIGGNLDLVTGGHLNLYGGTVNRLDVHGTGVADMYGGSIGQEIVMGDSGTITIYGSGFALDGIALPYGTYENEDFWPPGFEPRQDGQYDYVGGRLTGTLARGDALDTPFYFFFDVNRPTDSTLILVPEPSSALLLAAGLAAIGGTRTARRAKGSPARSAGASEGAADSMRPTGTMPGRPITSRRTPASA